MNVAGLVIGAVLPYVAAGLFLFSIAVRIYRWATIRHPLKWSLYPIPDGRSAQLVFMLKEVLSFRAVFHNNRKLWLGSWLFHIGIALIALWFVTFVSGLHLGLALRAGIALITLMPLYLLSVRLINPGLRAVSSPIEYFNLLIFIAIGASGTALLTFGKPDPEAVRGYFLGLLSFHPVPLAGSGLFLCILALSEFFMIYFPNSRMLHMVSKYFTYDKISWESH
ncbi:MAG: hypothetical protein M1491_04965 [Deltaproteobacteria bacterium]|nr:hypothetical protein [Deltaproteobacteria bacterium]MCL5276709.1 hypothetical protein [Deltaproteobacteria bacterium]